MSVNCECTWQRYTLVVRCSMKSPPSSILYLSPIGRLQILAGQLHLIWVYYKIGYYRPWSVYATWWDRRAAHDLWQRKRSAFQSFLERCLQAKTWPYVFVGRSEVVYSWTSTVWDGSHWMPPIPRDQLTSWCVELASEIQRDDPREGTLDATPSHGGTL